MIGAPGTEDGGFGDPICAERLDVKVTYWCYVYGTGCDRSLELLLTEWWRKT